MKAIIQVGGKQYKITNDSVIYIEKDKHNIGDKILFNDIIMIDGIFDSKILSKYKITGIVEKHSRMKKIIVFTYKPKKNTKRKLGHRQSFMQVKITDIPSIK